MYLLGLLWHINTQTALIFSVIFLLLFNFVRKQSWKNLPPGPPCLPILGSLPFLGFSDFKDTLRKLSQKYGDVYTVYLGQTRVVVLNSFDAIKEALQTKGQIFEARPSMYWVEDLLYRKGLVASGGDLWKEQRRFAMDVLREFGLGKSIMEDKIQEEIGFLVEELDSFKEQAVDPHPVIILAICNVIGSLVSGSRRDYADVEFKEQMKGFDKGFELSGKVSGILMLFPFLKHLPADLLRINELKANTKRCMDVFIKMIEDHKANFDPANEPQNFTDAYLKVLSKIKNEEESTFSDEQLAYVVGDLYAAGAETTTTTLCWAIVYLLNHPNVLHRVQEEIDEVLGPQQQPTMKHKLKMPYTEATIMEIQRMGDIVPFNVPHAPIEGVEFNGYHIPAGTVIFPNLNAVHRDEQYFKNPFEFDPSRFMNEDGSVRRIEQLIPFSIGRRLCLGEGLARMELFLVFTSLLQHFTPVLPPNQPLPSMTAPLNTTNGPVPYKVLFKRRL